MKKRNRMPRLETKPAESADTKVNGAVTAYQLGQFVNRLRYRVEALYVPSIDPEKDSINDILKDGLKVIDNDTERVLKLCDDFETSGIAPNRIQAMRSELELIRQECHNLWNTEDHLSFVRLCTDIENSEDTERESRKIDAMSNSSIGRKFWENYWRIFCELAISTPSPYNIFLLLGYIYDERFYLTTASYNLTTEGVSASHSKSDNHQNTFVSIYSETKIIRFWWPKIQKSFELISKYGSFGEERLALTNQIGMEAHLFNSINNWLENNLRHFIPNSEIINEIQTIENGSFDQQSLLELIINLAQNPSRPTPKLLYLDLNLHDKFKLGFKSLTTGSKNKCRKEKINEKLKKLTEHYKSYPDHFCKTKEICQLNSNSKSIPEPEIIRVLFYKDKACRIIYPNAKHIIKFLEDFEKEDWPSRIAIPVGKNDDFNYEVLLDACRSFKRDSEHLLLRVHTQDSKHYVIWEETTESKES